MKILIVISVVIVFLLVIFVLFIPQAANLEKKSNDSIGIQELDLSKEEVVLEEKSRSDKYVESQILVKFKKDVSEAEISDLIEEYGLNVLDLITNIKVYQLEISSGISVEEMIDELSGNSLIEYAEPNYVVEFEL